MATTFKKKNVKKVPWPADGVLNSPAAGDLAASIVYTNPYSELLKKKAAEAGLSNSSVAPSAFHDEWLSPPPPTEVHQWPSINSDVPVEVPMTTDTEKHISYRLEIFIKEKDEWYCRETLYRITYEDLEAAYQKYKKSFKEHINKDDVKWQKLYFVASYTNINGEVEALPEFYCVMEKEIKKDKVFLNGPNKKPLPFSPKVAKHYAGN